MQIKKANKKKQYKPELLETIEFGELGDIILYGKDYFEKLDNQEHTLEIFNLMAIDPDTWKVLEKIGINTTKLKEAVTYTCPYLKHQYYWCIPYAIVGKNLSTIREAALKVFSQWHVDYAMDADFFQSLDQNPSYPVESWNISDVTSLFLGSGYTEGTLISDGSRCRSKAKIPLDQKNMWIMVELWEWFNK